MPKPEEVAEFLKAFQARMRALGVVFQDQREKNTQAIVDLGIARNDRINVLKELKVLDYSEGPMKDWDNGPELWVFGKELKNREVYIKVTLGILKNGSVVCISFHPAEHPMKFPLR